MGSDASCDAHPTGAGYPGHRCFPRSATERAERIDLELVRDLANLLYRIADDSSAHAMHPPSTHSPRRGATSSRRVGQGSQYQSRGCRLTSAAWSRRWLSPSLFTWGTFTPIEGVSDLWLASGLDVFHWRVRQDGSITPIPMSVRRAFAGTSPGRTRSGPTRAGLTCVARPR